MSTTTLRIIQLALASAVAAVVFSGCDKKGDAISSAEQADKKEGMAVPGIEEIKAIAEEGFIYGLPLLMNYTANYEFWVDRTSKQYKCPFNQPKNEHRVFTYGTTCHYGGTYSTGYGAAVYHPPVAAVGVAVAPVAVAPVPVVYPPLAPMPYAAVAPVYHPYAPYAAGVYRRRVLVR